MPEEPETKGKTAEKTSGPEKKADAGKIDRTGIKT